MSEPAWRRYARFFHRDIPGDVDDEMDFHIQILAARYERDGHSPEEARAMAVREFGDRDKARKECIDIDGSAARTRGRADWFDTLEQDFRHGARRLIKNPVFAIVTVLTLAIGIGPTVAIFSIINSVLLEPLPYTNPDRLVLVQETFPLPGGSSGSGSVSYLNYVDWKAQTRTLDLLISSYTGNANLTGAGEPERLSVAGIGADAFDILGVKPTVGRGFMKGEDAPDGPNVAIIGDAFWRRHFNANRDAVGKTITIDGTPLTIVGVMPPTTTFPNRTAPVDVWSPLQFKGSPSSRGGHNFSVIGRLRPGVTIEQARGDMRDIAARLAQLYPQHQDRRSVVLTPFADVVVGGVRQQLAILFGAAVLVMLIACANAASLLLARAASRRREIAVLAALGANRGRVAQQFLVESILLAIGGALLGFVLSRFAVAAIVAGAGTSLPRSTQIHFDWRVVAFIVATVLLTTFIFGVAPALQATRVNLQDCLRGTRTGGGRESARFRGALVVAQFALSLTLLAGAGLLFRTFAALISSPTGMRTDRVLTMHIPLPFGSPKYKTADDALNTFYDPMLERVRALPGVQAAGAINLLPLQGYGSNGNFQILGKTYGSISDQPFAEFRVASPGYFGALGIPVVRGRDFAVSDRANTEQVVMVNQTLVDRYFAGEDPVGRSLQFGQPDPQNPPVIVVGVAGAVRQATLSSKPLPELYFPTGQASGQLGNMTLVVRTANDPITVQKAVQSAIHAVDPQLPVYGIKTMDEVVRTSVADRRLYLGLLGTFAAVALALAIAGIYGVMSYSVSQRTREFGIRLALGSSTSSVQRLVVWQGARLALLGLAIGIPAAFLASKLLSSVVYGVDVHDPLTFTVVAAVLAGVSVAASYLPARRVVHVDPMLAMRGE